MSRKQDFRTEHLELANWFKVLGEPNRLFLLDSIINGIQCNCELGKSLSLSPNLVSHHLSVLQEAGIIKARHDENDARWIYYSVNEQVSDQIRNKVGAFFDEKRIKPCTSKCGPG